MTGRWSVDPPWDEQDEYVVCGDCGQRVIPAEEESCFVPMCSFAPEYMPVETMEDMEEVGP